MSSTSEGPFQNDDLKKTTLHSETTHASNSLSNNTNKIPLSKCYLTNAQKTRQSRLSSFFSKHNTHHDSSPSVLQHNQKDVSSNPVTIGAPQKLPSLEMTSSPLPECKHEPYSTLSQPPIPVDHIKTQSELNLSTSYNTNRRNSHSRNRPKHLLSHYLQACAINPVPDPSPPLQCKPPPPAPASPAKPSVLPYKRHKSI